MTAHKIALIPGDGIGVDVTEATMQVLAAAGTRFGFTLSEIAELLSDADLRGKLLASSDASSMFGLIAAWQSAQLA